MTTRILTGTYSAGYSLSPNYSALRIAASAEIDGTGLMASAPAVVKNFGIILADAAVPEGAPGANGISLQSGGHVANFGHVAGGQGGSSYYRVGYGYAPAGAGGAGMSVAAGGGVINRGVASGGVGGTGDARDPNADGANGGAGGYGIGLSDGGTVANSGLLTGGEGGAGCEGGPTSFFGGIGGAGGAGVEIGAAAGHLTNNKGVIVGGKGGVGGKAQYNGGFGGYGGAGVFAAAGAGVMNNGLILGGMGGRGGATADHYNPSGYGGAGGDGVVIEGFASLMNGGTITGGQGAAAAAGAPFQGPGGGGGVGVFFLPEDGYVDTLVNRGSIAGGNGGKGGAAIGEYVGGGVGGYGIFLDGVTAVLDNEGAVSGGAGGDCGYGYHADVGSGGGDGIVFSSSGSLVNNGTVTGGHGGDGGRGPKSTVAAGGVGGVGIYLRTAASLTNRGMITGGQGGAGPGPAGARGDGVVIVAGGDVANVAGGVIKGDVGVYVAGPSSATVVNAGTISGDLNSVEFSASGDLLIAQAGAKFVGAIAGGGGTFDVTGGTGTITNLGLGGRLSGADSGVFSGFSAYEISGGGDWSLANQAIVSAAQSLLVGPHADVLVSNLLDSDGNLSISAGGRLEFGDNAGGGLGGTVVNNGVLRVDNAIVTFIGVLSGTGKIEIGGGIADFEGSQSQDVTFTSGKGELSLLHSRSFTAAITGFTANGKQQLDLRDIGFVNADQATFSGTGSGGVLSVTDGTHTARIEMVGDYVGDTFTTTSDDGTGVFVTATAAPLSVSSHAFVAAMAGLGASVGGHLESVESWGAREPLLTSPRVQAA